MTQSDPEVHGSTEEDPGSIDPPTAVSPPGTWVLSPDDRRQPAGRVFALVLDGQLQDFRRHEAGVRADLDPAYLHDFRVALRRGRSLLSAGRTVFPRSSRKGLAASMRLLADVTSEVRDLDVLIEAIEVRGGSLSAGLGDGTQLLLAALQLRRGTVVASMQAVLDDERYRTLVRGWQSVGAVYRIGGDEPGRDALRSTGRVVDAAIMAEFRDVRRAGRTAHASDALEDWHELRKQLKRLRYLVVAFAPLYPEGSMDQVIRRVRKLQNVLGRLQDHATEICLIESVGIAAGGRAALTAGALSDQLQRSTDEDLERCLGAWVRFDQRTVRRLLRDAIAVAVAD